MSAYDENEEIDPTILVDSLDDQTIYNLQRFIFANCLLDVTKDVHKNNKVMYFMDGTTLYKTRCNVIKGPCETVFSEKDDEGIYDLLSKQFKIVEARLKSQSKKNPKLQEVIRRSIEKLGKSAFLPSGNHIKQYKSLLKYINRDLIPSKYVVLCIIRLSEMTAELDIEYHFCRWYSLQYIKQSVNTFQGDFFSNMLGLVVNDTVDNPYVFPHNVNADDDIQELTEDDMPDLIYIQ